MPISNPQTDKVDIKKASRMWRSGHSASEIGALFDVSRNVIIGLASRNRGLFPAKAKTREENEAENARNAEAIDLELMAEMWEAGKTTNEIALSFNVHMRAVQKVIRQNRAMFKKRPRSGIFGYRKGSEVKSTPKPAFDFKTPPSAYDEARLPFSKTLMDLKAFECKAPLNDGSPYLFCAEKAVGSYCQHHTHRFFRVAA